MESLSNIQMHWNDYALLGIIAFQLIILLVIDYLKSHKKGGNK